MFLGLVGKFIEEAIWVNNVRSWKEFEESWEVVKLLKEELRRREIVEAFVLLCDGEGDKEERSSVDLRRSAVTLGTVSSLDVLISIIDLNLYLLTNCYAS